MKAAKEMLRKLYEIFFLSLGPVIKEVHPLPIFSHFGGYVFIGVEGARERERG